MRAARARFLHYVPAGAHLLDAGCGSGRDSLAFIQAGYRVTAFDACAELCEAAQQLTGLAIAHQRFLDPVPPQQVGGIWACASLLHVPLHDLPTTMAHLATALVPGGAFYASFKWGTGERVDADGRHFTDLNTDGLEALLAVLPDLHLAEHWQNSEARGDHSVRWFNIIVTRAS